MKYIQWDCSNFRNPKLEQALKLENYHVGKNIYITKHEVVGQFFDYGSWWKNGKQGVPYSYMTSMQTFMNDCKVEDEDEMIRILEKLKEYQISDYTYDTEKGYLVLICPDLMKMSDRTQRENKYWKQTSVAERKQLENYWNVEDSTNSVQQIREDDSKVNNLNLSETNKEDNILTDRNKEDTKVHKQKLKNAMSLLKVKKVDGSIDDMPF